MFMGLLFHPRLQNNLDEEKHNGCHQEYKACSSVFSLLSPGLILDDGIFSHMFIAKFTVVRLPFTIAGIK